MNLTLIHHSQIMPLDLPANRGFDLSKILALLEQLKKLGVSWEAIDMSRLSDEELSHLYSEAIRPAVYHKYPIRQVFGSKRNSRYMFGKGVPALIVYEPGKQFPSHTFPHGSGDRIVTIKTFLEGLLKKLERAPMTVEGRRPKKALVERMDRLREKIGPIGVPVADLIRGGRRR